MIKLANWLYFIGSLVRSLAYPIRDTLPLFKEMMDANKDDKSMRSMDSNPVSNNIIKNEKEALKK